MLDERDQRLADHMREGAGASGGEAQHLKAVRQRAGMAALAAIFDVVMDRVVVGRDGLEGGKISFGDGAARDVEALADRKILEKPAVRKAVPPPVECFALNHLSLLPSCHCERSAALLAMTRGMNGLEPHSIGRPPVTGIIAPVM